MDEWMKLLFLKFPSKKNLVFFLSEHKQFPKIANWHFSIWCKLVDFFSSAFPGLSCGCAGLSVLNPISHWWWEDLWPLNNPSQSTAPEAQTQELRGPQDEVCKLIYKCSVTIVDFSEPIKAIFLSSNNTYEQPAGCPKTKQSFKHNRKWRRRWCEVKRLKEKFFTVWICKKAHVSSQMYVSTELISELVYGFVTVKNWNVTSQLILQKVETTVKTWAWLQMKHSVWYLWIKSKVCENFFFPTYFG